MLVETRLDKMWRAGSPGIKMHAIRRAAGPAFVIIAATMLCPAVSPVPADPVGSSYHSFLHFRDAEGLPQNTIHTITLDHTGYLWTGTQDGAARYDGKQWSVVDMPNRIRSNFVRTIISTADGSLWFGTQADGLHRQRNGHWQNDTGYPAGAAYRRINALGEFSPSGENFRLWAGTHDGGLLSFDGRRWDYYTMQHGLPANRIWAIHRGPGPDGQPALWVGTEKGAVRWIPDENRFQSDPGSPARSFNSLLPVTGPGGQETLWAGTYGAGLYVYRHGQWTPFAPSPIQLNPFITSLAPDSKDGLWVSTDGGGIAHIQNQQVNIVDIGSGLPSNSVYALLQTDAADGIHALWIGTRNSGLACLREGQWRHFRPSPGGIQLPVNAIAETGTDPFRPVIWFGSDGGGLARLEGGGWSFYNRRNSPLPSDIVQCLLEVPGKKNRLSLWAGTRNGGLVHMDGPHWTIYNQAGGSLPNDIVQALALTYEKDGTPVIWAGTRGGLASFQHGAWQNWGKQYPFLQTSVTCLLPVARPDGSWRLWTGSATGLALLENGHWQDIPVISQLPNSSVQSLCETTRQLGRPTLWIGTDGGGLAILEVQTRQLLANIHDRSSPALPDNVIYRIFEDSGHRLYLSSNKGIIRLIFPPSSRQGLDNLDIFTFTVSNGLPLNQGIRGSGLVDRRGRIWAGTVGGAAVYDPNLEQPDRSPKRLLLQGWCTSGPRRHLGGGEALSFRQNRVYFEFSLLSYFREEETRYRVQLAGLDEQPSPWMKDWKIEYPSLPDGSYTFQVWGQDYAGNISGPSSLSFVVKPPLWNSWWGLTLLVGLFALAAFAFVKIRLRSHHRRENELVSLVDARTRELKEANQILMDLSYLDPLTKIANRRRFEERLDVEWKRAIRAKFPVALIMADIDHFKLYNDHFGHQQGDDCLKAVASSLADGLSRTGDSVARFGGEEFVIILPQTGTAGALQVADRLRQRIQEMAMPHPHSRHNRILTISCGVASLQPVLDNTPAELIAQSDQALYRAKHRGGNLALS